MIIPHYVAKKSEISEYGFQTKLNKNIGISLSSGFININDLYHMQFFHEVLFGTVLCCAKFVVS